MSDLLGKVAFELKMWAHQGLVPHFTNDTMQDVVLSNVLQAVREHLVKERLSCPVCHIEWRREDTERYCLCRPAPREPEGEEYERALASWHNSNGWKQPPRRMT
jgi:hypothetical protein